MPSMAKVTDRPSAILPIRRNQVGARAMASFGSGNERSSSLASSSVVAPDDSPATGGSDAGGDLNVTQPTAHGATGGVPPGHFEEQHGGAVGSAHGGAVGSASGLLVSTDPAPVESK